MHRPNQRHAAAGQDVRTVRRTQGRSSVLVSCRDILPWLNSNGQNLPLRRDSGQSLINLRRLPPRGQGCELQFVKIAEGLLNLPSLLIKISK